LRTKHFTVINAIATTINIIVVHSRFALFIVMFYAYNYYALFIILLYVIIVKT